jgi:hypothetical protein
MNRTMRDDYLDLRRADLDPDMFAGALALQYIERLLTCGGSDFGRPGDEQALHPSHLAAFLARAVEAAQRNARFEKEWQRLQRTLPQIQGAWKKGQALFQEELARAVSNKEEMEYLSQIDFAVDCYASVTARNAYPHDRVLQNWAINGYMSAWQQRFFTGEEAGSE